MSRWLCFPRRAAAAHVTSHIRRHRRARRVAIAAAAKPLAWTCVLVLPFAVPLAAIPFMNPPLPPGGPSAGAESLWAISPRRDRHPTPVPEPGSLALLATAVAAMLWRLRS